MGEKIRLEMSDWLYNAGLVGLYNILENAGDYVESNGQSIEFDTDLFENFEEKYFNYFIDKYEKTLSWYKIVSYEEVIRQHENNDLQSFQEKDLEALNTYLKNVVKNYLNSASYKSAYDLINSELDIIRKVKVLDSINLKKQEIIEDKLPDIKATFEKLKIIIKFCNEEKSKKYLAAKNVIYSIIRNAWDGICFLNPQTKEKDMYVDYREYFVEPMNEYLESDKTKNKYNCFTCDKPVNNLNNDLGFINNFGFDVSRKSSHVWNFANDVAVCPLCKLVYSCVPAGFTYTYDKGIYINDNSTFENAKRINNKIRMEILQETEFNSLLTYKSLINAINEQSNETTKYELADIQIIKLKDNKYSFNILSRPMLSIIHRSKDDLSKIITGGFLEIKTYFNIYELVIDRVLNNQNLFTLIHKLLIFKLSKSKDCKFSISQVVKVMIINLRIMEGMGYMQKTEKDIIKLANASGYYLREEYKGKGSKDKLNGIAYRLLNALKTCNNNMFMDTVLNCYLYVQKTVPSIFLEALRDEEQYKTIGYAFVSGLIEGKDDGKKNGGEQNDK